MVLARGGELTFPKDGEITPDCPEKATLLVFWQYATTFNSRLCFTSCFSRNDIRESAPCYFP